MKFALPEPDDYIVIGVVLILVGVWMILADGGCL